MKLILPEKAYYTSYRSALREYQKHQVTTYSFLDGSVQQIFQKIENYRNGTHLADNRVPATFLWMVENKEFLAEVSIRHYLTDALLRIGSNIGYGVRWSHWNHGIGTELLAQSLLYARQELNLPKALITCNDDNHGSARIIEKNGGILQDKIINCIDGQNRVTRRYWVVLSPD